MKNSLVVPALGAYLASLACWFGLGACGTAGERKDEPMKGGEVEGKGKEVAIPSWSFAWKPGPFEIEHTIQRIGAAGPEVVVVSAHGEVVDSGENWRVVFSKVTLETPATGTAPKDLHAALRAGGTHAFADAWPALVIGKADGGVVRVEGAAAELTRVRELHANPKIKRAPSVSETAVQAQAVETLAIMRWSAWVVAFAGWDAPIGQARQFTYDPDKADGLSVPLSAAERRLPLTAGLERAEIMRTYAGDALTKKVKADLLARGQPKAKISAVTKVVREQTITAVTDPATLRSQRIEQRDVFTLRAYAGKNEQVETLAETDAWVFTW